LVSNHNTANQPSFHQIQLILAILDENLVVLFCWMVVDRWDLNACLKGDASPLPLIFYAATFSFFV